MTSVYHILATLLFLLVVIREGLALRCVVCNSEAQKECDVTPDSFVEDCPTNTTSCRKMEQEIYYDDDYHVRTIRQCAIESGPLKCIERTGTYRFKVFYCHCDEDGCNSASAFSLSLVLASVSAAVAFLVKL